MENWGINLRLGCSSPFGGCERNTSRLRFFGGLEVGRDDSAPQSRELRVLLRAASFPGAGSPALPPVPKSTLWPCRVPEECLSGDRSMKTPAEKKNLAFAAQETALQSFSL